MSIKLMKKVDGVIQCSLPAVEEKQKEANPAKNKSTEDNF